MRRAPRALAVAIFLASACAGPRAVDLRLVPDPNVNRPEDVVAAIDTLLLVVDADEPLYLPGEERSDGTVQIENADADPTDLELVATIAVPEGRLPTIRIEQGTLPDVALTLRLLGQPAEPGAPLVAVGRVSGVHLGAPPAALDVPFNLRPELLPPRVAEVLPGEGSQAPDCQLDRVYLMFSRPVDAASLTGAVHVTPGSVEGVRLDPSGLTAELTVSGVSGDGTRLRYAVRVDPTVRDLEGRALDQVPAEAGAQGLEVELTLGCGPAPSLPVSLCGAPEGPLTPTCPNGEGRVACVDGHCVPSRCDNALCMDGTVCDPATAACVLDCRAWGEAEVCPAARPRCEPTTGACVE